MEVLIASLIVAGILIVILSAFLYDKNKQLKYKDDKYQDLVLVIQNVRDEYSVLNSTHKALKGDYRDLIGGIKSNNERNIRDVLGYNTSISELETANQILKSDLELSDKRILDLEDGVETGYGVKVRTIVEEIKCEFDKHEMTFINKGVRKLLEAPNMETYDIEYYLNLVKKIEATLVKMPDIIPEKEEEKKDGIS